MDYFPAALENLVEQFAKLLNIIDMTYKVELTVMVVAPDSCNRIFIC